MTPMNTPPYAAAFRPRSFTVRPAWRRAAAALLLAVGGVAAQAQILIGQTTAVTARWPPAWVRRWWVCACTWTT